jgi:hypothetical protein
MPDDLGIRELIREANMNGSQAGMIALIQYVQLRYPDDIGTKLQIFLDLTLTDCFEKVSNYTEVPAEDVALRAKQVMDKVVDKD